MPLNPAFNAGQVVAALSHLDVSHLIITLETNLPFKSPRSNIPLLEQLVPNLGGSKLESDAVPSLRQVIIVDNSAGRIDVEPLRALSKFDHILGDQSPRSLPDQRLDNNDIVNIQFTSGTTSMPKAACLSHRSILNNGFSIGERMLLTHEDVVCCPPPLFHCFGCILGYMATATHGAGIIFPTEAFDPRATLLAVQENKATALYGVPTMFLAELDLISSGAVANEGFHHLRTGIAAGSSIPAELMRKLHRVLGLTELTICYGMTETSPVSCMTTTDDPLQKRIDTVGRLLPHVSAKVVDPADHSNILPIGQRGELAVSGYSVMKGYWNDPVRTKEAFLQDGDRTWMLTGDEASMDEEGYVTITGRIKDLIIRGGENIHPLEIESCLLAHDGVYEASVVGLPDSKYGEVVAAFIIRRSSAVGELTEKQVRDHVRTNLSPHLVPKYVFWVTEYPKTASGKIQKFVLRKEGIDMAERGEGLS